MAKEKSGAPAPIWKGAEYTRMPEGNYSAVATRFQGPMWVRQYSRWSLLVEFELLSDNTRVCAFYNLGEDRKGPKVGRQSRYSQAWIRANGEPPRKHQTMPPEVFLEGQVYTLKVRDNRKNAKEQDKADSEIYSVVEEIVSVDRQALPQSRIT